jgi:hypothetical protein
MAKFSKKMGGKEVGDASVYAKPHTEIKQSKGAGPSGSKSLQDLAAVNVFNEKDFVKHSTPVTIGKLKEVKTGGIKMRGTGAATKGTMSRGPMA